MAVLDYNSVKSLQQMQEKCEFTAYPTGEKYSYKTTLGWNISSVGSKFRRKRSAAGFDDEMKTANENKK